MHCGKTFIPPQQRPQTPKHELSRRYIDDSVGATSSTREELINQFITSVNSFPTALKYTWEISDTS